MRLAQVENLHFKDPSFSFGGGRGRPLRPRALLPFSAMALSLRLNRSRWTCPSDAAVDPECSGACWELATGPGPCARCEQHALLVWSEFSPTAEGTAGLDYPTGKTVPFRSLSRSIRLFRIAERKLSSLSTWFGESEVNPVLECCPLGASVFTWHSVLRLGDLSAPQGPCL